MHSRDRESKLSRHSSQNGHCLHPQVRQTESKEITLVLCPTNCVVQIVGKVTHVVYTVSHNRIHTILVRTMKQYRHFHAAFPAAFLLPSCSYTIKATHEIRLGCTSRMLVIFPRVKSLLVPLSFFINDGNSFLIFSSWLSKLS